MSWLPGVSLSVDFQRLRRVRGRGFRVFSWAVLGTSENTILGTFPGPLAPTRRGGCVRECARNSLRTGRVLVRHGLHLITRIVQGCRGTDRSPRSLVSVNAVNLVGTMVAFSPRGKGHLTTCTSHYMRGRILVCLHTEGGYDRRVSLCRPVNASQRKGRIGLCSVVRSARASVPRQVRLGSGVRGLCRGLRGRLSPERGLMLGVQCKLCRKRRCARQRVTTRLNVSHSCMSHVRGDTVKGLQRCF